MPLLNVSKGILLFSHPMVLPFSNWLSRAGPGAAGRTHQIYPWPPSSRQRSSERAAPEPAMADRDAFLPARGSLAKPMVGAKSSCVCSCATPGGRIQSHPGKPDSWDSQPCSWKTPSGDCDCNAGSAPRPIAIAIGRTSPPSPENLTSYFSFRSHSWASGDHKFRATLSRRAKITMAHTASTNTAPRSDVRKAPNES